MIRKNDKRGKFELGMGLLIVFFILAITSFGLIDVFKEVLDDVRGGDNLNCHGVSDFNQTAFDQQDSLARLTNRPTCFVTGMSMVYFIGAVLIAGAVWVVDNWRKK